MKKIAIQGVRGSFHHQVAQAFFGKDIDIVECLSFPALIDDLLAGKATDAVMAIENSIAGAILPNYALLDTNDLTIEGEFYLDVKHNLMAIQGQTINDIQEVWSHPMALLQCREFFRAYPHIKLVEDTDTAAVARYIHKNNKKGIGAIASTTAATLYDLEILAPEIQTIQDNATRFFILHTNGKEETMVDKASLRFTTEHKRGSLATILNVLSDCKLNLTKIQSMPTIETPWRYAFFVDVTFDAIKNFEKAITILPVLAQDFKILGTYKNKKK